MSFILGLEQLSREELISLLAQIKTMSTITIIKDRFKKSTKKVKDFIFDKAAKVANKINPNSTKAIINMKNAFDWDADELNKKLKTEIKRYESLDNNALKNELFSEMKRIAGVEKDLSNELLANATVHRAAKSFNIDTRLYLDAVSLEMAVFEEALKEIIESIKEKIDKMSAEEIANLESILQKEIMNLSKGEQEALKKSIGIETISAKAMIQFIRTSSTAAIVQIILNSFGFGLFLFLTTMLKALSLLLGITIPFGVYTTMTLAFSFILSIPFLLLVLTISGGIIYSKTERKLEDQFAKILILVGRGKLLARNNN